MAITITVPSDTHAPNDSGHTTDHNTIVDALTALAAAAANTAGDTFTGGITMVGIAAPSAPASNRAVLYANTVGAPSAKLDSTYAGVVALGSPADKSSHTATAATPTAITATWTIPAGDANVGTLYRLTFFGFGTWGSTQQALTMNARLDAGSTMAGGGTGQIQATAIAISTGIFIRGVVEVLIVSTGAGGTATVTQEFTVIARSSLLPGTAANNTITSLNSNSTSGGTVAYDTTASHTLDMSCTWASTTGSPTMTGTQSFLERICA